MDLEWLLVIIVWGAIVYFYVKGPVSDKIIAIASVIISLMVAGAIAFPVLLFMDNFYATPEWLIALIAFLIVSLFIKILMCVNKFLKKKHKEYKK